jgi:hypothetical protein
MFGSLYCSLAIHAIACLLSIAESFVFPIHPASIKILQSTSINSEDFSFYDEANEAESLHNSIYTQVLSTSLPIAKDLRKHYNSHFQDPREPMAVSP